MFQRLVIASRQQSHMTNNNLYEELQSSYRKFYSTETALTCVHDDILRAIDDNKSVLLIMLYLSAAFDTDDHNVLLERLKSGLGISGTAFNWFKSYLSGKSQFGVRFHMYADDCQLYTTFEASDINQTALNMDILINDIHHWYSDNMLKF